LETNPQLIVVEIGLSAAAVAPLINRCSV